MSDLSRRAVIRRGSIAASVGGAGLAAATSEAGAVEVPVSGGVEVTRIPSMPNFPGFYYVGSINYDDACYYGQSACVIGGGIGALARVSSWEEFLGLCGATAANCRIKDVAERMQDAHYRWLHIYHVAWWLNWWINPPDWYAIPATDDQTSQLQSLSSTHD